PDRDVLILTTGSQGEPMAALTRIANGSHKQVQIKKGDTVVFSANPIPGNTIAVVNTIDKLMMQGANVIYGKQRGIHVSGHGAQEDQKLMLALTRPKFFLPVHGEHRMLVKHGQTAQGMGVPAENMVIIDNGDIVELTPDSIQASGKVPSGIELVDSSRSGVVRDQVLKERQQMAGDGIVTIAATVGIDGALAARPEMHLRGVVTSAERSHLEEKVVQTLESALENYWPEVAPNYGNGNVEVDWARLKATLETELRRLFRRELKSSPMLVFLMQTPVESTRAKRRRSLETAKVAS
ncbi:MAG: ribonuclease J, partial [Cyanobacteria bacterium J06638_22]